MFRKREAKTKEHVVIVGGGFGGLYAAKNLGNSDVEVTLIDKRNFHLFQPLLYQVASGGLSASDIASPLRGVLSKYKNISVLKSEVMDIDPNEKLVICPGQSIKYDKLILATGSSHHYFNNDEWSKYAPGLKTVEDALEMRRRILQAFEDAENEKDTKRQKSLMRFVIVGGGPTGVELAGALGELSKTTLKNDFKNIAPSKSEIYLLEGLDSILSNYPEKLSSKAKKSLERLGVEVRTNSIVSSIHNEAVYVKNDEKTEIIQAHTILWAAGVKASFLGKVLSIKTGVELDKTGRVIVEKDLTIPSYKDIFVIGDLAHFLDEKNIPLPGVAPVAMQQGYYVANLIKRKTKAKKVKAFNYKNKGNLAVIGRNAAIADLGVIKLSGFIAWMIWLYVHLRYLVEFESKILVLFQWGWNYFTRNKSARLITGNYNFEPIDKLKNIDDDLRKAV